MKLLRNIVFLVLNIVLAGLVVSCYWAWFIVPLGVPSIGYAHAVGIFCFVSVLTWKFIHSDLIERRCGIEWEMFKASFGLKVAALIVGGIAWYAM